jgi:protein O-mannosyl-transferase
MSKNPKHPDKPEGKLSPTPQREVHPVNALAARPAFIAWLLVAVVVALYVPVAGYDYINLDDNYYITYNPEVLAGLTWHGVKWAFAAPHLGNWIPLAWLSYMLDVSVFGPGAGGPHLVNALFHALNAALVFWLVWRLTDLRRNGAASATPAGTLWRSAFVAALWALHPLRVESVAWVCERRDVLSAFFGLLALICYASYAKKAESKKQKAEMDGRSPSSILHPLSSRSYWFSLFFFTLGLMSKPMLVTLPLMLLLLDFWPLERFTICDLRFANLQSLKSLVTRLSSLFLEKLPFFALSAIFSALTVWGQIALGSMPTLASLPFYVRLENVFVSYARYLGKIFWPAELAVQYPYVEHWPTSLAVLSIGLVVGLCIGSIWQTKRRPYVPMGWFWFLATLLPVIGLLQAGNQSMADRFTYLPFIGLAIAVTWIVCDLLPRGLAGTWLKGALAMALLAACALRSDDQLRTWENSGTVFRNALAVTKDDGSAHAGLGSYLLVNGQFDEGIRELQLGLKITPRNAGLLSELANVLGNKKGRYSDAAALYQAALRADPADAKIHYRYARMLAHMGKTDEMIGEYRATLRLNPGHVEAHNFLGMALAGQGKIGEALDHFQAAVRLKPDFAEAHCNLGNALAGQDKYAEAIAQYQEALRLNPNYAHAENNLASALESGGQTNEAVAHYQAALRLDANAPMTHFNFGSLLARLGRRDEAIAQLRAALRLQPDYEDAKQKLQELGGTLPK